MAGDDGSSEAISSGAEQSPDEHDVPDERAGSERLDPARRRPWLGIICAALLVLAGVAWWVHAEDPFNPYRDGTTHPATLTYTDPPCMQGWTVTVASHRYSWQNTSPVPAALQPGPVQGEVHILRQRVDAFQGATQVGATFTAQGVTIDLVGGHGWWSDLSCSIN